MLKGTYGPEKRYIGILRGDVFQWYDVYEIEFNYDPVRYAESKMMLQEVIQMDTGEKMHIYSSRYLGTAMAVPAAF